MTPDHTEVPLAYLITFTTRGTWLHGDARGSVDLTKHGYGDPLVRSSPGREDAARRRICDEVVLLDTPRRVVVDRTIREVCVHREWTLRALNVRTNHLQGVVSAPVVPERVMNDFKAYATRRLVEAGLVERGATVWTRHGSTRYLWDAADMHGARRYVEIGQGDALPGVGDGKRPSLQRGDRG